MAVGESGLAEPADVVGGGFCEARVVTDGQLTGPDGGSGRRVARAPRETSVAFVARGTGRRHCRSWQGDVRLPALVPDGLGGVLIGYLGTEWAAADGVSPVMAGCGE